MDWSNVYIDWDNLLPTRTDDSMAQSALQRQRDAEAAKVPLINPAILALFQSSAENRSHLEYLRAVVEDDSWYIPLRPDGSWDVVTTREGQYESAILMPGESTKRKNTRGAGGRMLRVWATEPKGTSKMITGRDLVRGMPEELDGWLLDDGKVMSREVHHRHFEEMRRYAGAVALEEMLTNPAPGQVEAILNATWYAQVKEGELRSSDYLAVVYTHPDRTNSFTVTETQPVTGREFFTRVQKVPGIDGVVVNGISRFGRGARTASQLHLSHGIIHQWLQGEDIRPFAGPLPARSFNEVVLWLTMARFPYEQRVYVEAPHPGGLLLRAMVPGNHNWNDLETGCSPSLKFGPIWSPVFLLPPGGRDVPGYGEGATRLLCAGLLAKELNATSPFNKDASAYWRVGKNLLLGRLLDDQDIRMSLARLDLARELAKLLPPGADAIPPEALLTVAGARVFREHPHARTRGWIEETVRQAERYTRKWVAGR